MRLSARAFSIRATLALLISILAVLPAAASNIAYDGTGTAPGGAGGDLNIGREFTVTGSGITVYDLGVYDNAGHTLLDSHPVTLFSINTPGPGATATPLAGGSVTIPAGLSDPSQFVYEPLANPLFLPAGNYAVIAYGTNTARDGYGDGGGLPAGPNVTHGGFDPYQFTSAGSPAFPPSGDINNHSSASLIYNVGNTAPEPASLVLFAMGGVGLFFVARRRQAKALDLHPGGSSSAQPTISLGKSPCRRRVD